MRIRQFPMSCYLIRLSGLVLDEENAVTRKRRRQRKNLDPSYTPMCASTCTVCIQLYVELQAAKWKARDVARSLRTHNFVVFVFFLDGQVSRVDFLFLSFFGCQAVRRIRDSSGLEAGEAAAAISIVSALIAFFYGFLLRSSLPCP